MIFLYGFIFLVIAMLLWAIAEQLRGIRLILNDRLRSNLNSSTPLLEEVRAIRRTLPEEW